MYLSYDYLFILEDSLFIVTFLGEARRASEDLLIRNIFLIAIHNTYLAMNIVDDFESRYTSKVPGPTEYADLGPGFSDDFVVPSASDLPLLSVDTAVKQTAR